ncbi:hypothetical protein K435DRAFT_963910 [Dendrothele bispora CBS 962.96]|uniref:Uncharacterized protein n=1 Tax=Dendrothele bispora (strain CBS 962.96) TaxID=1314807 RepID=A0A4S8MDF8_DENBC|nr:hypothetical protein K435DRAFT_963910 [Dendrothele bispora CBS 962.96]
MNSLLDEYISGRRRVEEPIVLPLPTSESLRSILENEEKRILELSTLVDKLLQEIDERKKTVTLVANVLSPIRRLPPEILAEIFENYVEPENFYEVYTEGKGDDNAKRPARRWRYPTEGLYNILPRFLLLSQICVQWRNIVQLTPQLWTQIDLFVKKSLPDKQLIHEWLQRSCSLSIDIKIIFERDDIPGRYEFFNWFIPYSERWRSLSLNRPLVSMFNGPPPSLPNLQRVIMPLPSRLERPRTVLRDVPQLTHLEIFSDDWKNYPNTSPLDFPFSLSNITVLCLQYLILGAPGCFRRFMCACPLLETCQLLDIPDFLQDFIPIPSFPPARLPYLKNLTLRFKGYRSSPEILNNLCLPELGCLVLQQEYSELSRKENLDQVAFLPFFVSLQERSGFQLRRFVLQPISESFMPAPPDTVDDLVDFLKLNPTLELLDLEDCRFDIPLLCRKLKVDSPSSTLEPLVPNLIRLRIAQRKREKYPNPNTTEFDYREYSPDTDSDIAEMVLSRWNPPQRPGQDGVNGDTANQNTLVQRLKDGFTFRAYSRELSPDVLSRLENCKAEGMPLCVTTGKDYHDYEYY